MDQTAVVVSSFKSKPSNLSRIYIYMYIYIYIDSHVCISKYKSIPLLTISNYKKSSQDILDDALEAEKALLLQQRARSPGVFRLHAFSSPSMVRRKRHRKHNINKQQHRIDLQGSEIQLWVSTMGTAHLGAL